MILQEFIQKYDGKGIDFDGSFGNQCMDLYRQYVKEVLSFPQSPPVPSAKNVWTTYLQDYFEKVENTPSGVPRSGDVVIWGDGIGEHGHIAIYVEGNAKKFKSFDQNFPVGTLCHIQEHTYKAVLGWLVPKEQNTPINMIPKWFETLLQEKGLNIGNESEIRSVFDKAKKYDDETTALKEQVKSISEALADRAGEVSVLTEKNQRLTDEATEAKDQLGKARSERDTADWKAKQANIKVKTLEEEVKYWKVQVKDFQENTPLMSYPRLERFLSLFRF